MDKDLKEQFANLCEQLGLTISTAINLFAKAVIREKGIPFAISINEYNEETKQAIDDAEHHRNLTGPFKTTEELMNSLLKESN